MFLPITAGAVVATAALALMPAGAFARPAEQVDNADHVNAVAAQDTPAEYAGRTVVVERHVGGGGLDTIAVLALAGGTLVVGAAGGFGGGRAVTRRHTVGA